MNEIRNKQRRRVFDYVSEKLILRMKIGDIEPRSSFTRFATLHLMRRSYFISILQIRRNRCQKHDISFICTIFVFCV